eukprot:TRINITY_DN6601_c0_g2_i8.p2 TRINITY_DN6601_c0_g2~~TRINITY_DN6601_c0_g2_i8.p2  ORF type:complete len:157 (+),score=15.62 TRINITY_DN6601_c0_g2_i8:48-473(+)
MCIRDSTNRGLKISLYKMDKSNVRLKYIDKINFLKASSTVVNGSIALEEAKCPAVEENAKTAKDETQDTNKSAKDESSVLVEGEKSPAKFGDSSGEGFSLNYIDKRGRDCRMKYMNQLAYKGIWVPVSEKPKTHQTGIVHT